MILVERLKRWHGLSQLRARTKSAPSAAAYAALAERHISLGELDLALAAAEQGLASFPDADRLLHVRVYVLKERLGGRIRALREEIRRRPAPQAYLELAGLYRRLGSDEEALDVARDCEERFSHHEGGFLLTAELRFARFVRDMTARDAVVAELSLRRALALNSQNAAAHRRLAELSWIVGHLPSVAAHLAQVMLLAPGDAAVEAFAAEIEASPPRAEGKARFEELAVVVQEARAFANDPARFPGAEAPPSGARAQVNSLSAGEAMNALRTREGVRNALLLAASGAHVADVRADAGIAAADFQELVREILRLAGDASRRMDTGGLVRTEIESPLGSLHVANVRGHALALLYGPPMTPADAQALVQDFTTSQLAAAKESADA